MTKFNVGDYVRCNINSYSGSFTKGKVYKVRTPKTEFGSLGIELDDVGSKTNGMREDAFDLVRKHDEPFQVGDKVKLTYEYAGASLSKDIYRVGSVYPRGMFPEICYISPLNGSSRPVERQFLILVEPAPEHKVTVTLPSGECNEVQTELSLQDAIYIEAEAGIPLTKVADVINAIEERGFMLIKKGK